MVIEGMERKYAYPILTMILNLIFKMNYFCGECTKHDTSVLDQNGDAAAIALVLKRTKRIARARQEMVI